MTGSETSPGAGTIDRGPPAWWRSTRRERIKGHGLIALVGAATLVLSREGPVAILVGGAATSGVFLYGFTRLNPRWVGIELIMIGLYGYFALPEAPVFWVLGSAVGGGVAALLTRLDSREDSQFFLPPFAAALATFALFSLARRGGWAESFAIVQGYIESYARAFEMLLALPENAEFSRDVKALESWERIEPEIGLLAVCTLTALWVLVMWLFNRFARRRSGAMEGMWHSLLLFRIRPAYTFVLIVAMVLEILSLWLEREGLHAIAYPLFAVCAAAFLMVHLGVVFFMVAVRRAGAEGGSMVGFSLLILLALALSIYIGPIIGLVDVWFDFRKTKLLPSA